MLFSSGNYPYIIAYTDEPKHTMTQITVTVFTKYSTIVEITNKCKFVTMHWNPPQDFDFQIDLQSVEFI